MVHTFTKNVKREICSYNYKPEEIVYLIYGFLSSFRNKGNDLILNVNDSNKFILDFIIKNFKKNTPEWRDLLFFYNGDKNKILVKDDYFEKKFNFFNKNKLKTKKVFLSGVFLAAGSVNSPRSKTYHLEFRFVNEKFANDVYSILNYLKFNPRILLRQKKYVLYLKKSNEISDILKIFNATQSMLDYEDKRITRDFVTQMNRLNNLDISNIKKLSNASYDQIKYIKFIFANKNLKDSLSKNEILFCTIRLSHPEYSIADISNEINFKYKLNLTKSAINHYVRKIKKIYLFNKNS